MGVTWPYCVEIMGPKEGTGSLWEMLTGYKTFEGEQRGGLLRHSILCSIVTFTARTNMQQHDMRMG